MPVGVLEAAAGTKGDRGRLLGAAGEGGLFLGFGVLILIREEVAKEGKHWSDIVGGTGFIAE